MTGVVAAVCVALGAMGVVWALSLPAETTATQSAVIAAPPETVFRKVTDIQGQTAWRSDMKTVTLGADKTSWAETTTRGLVINFREVERAPSSLYVLAFSSPQGFEGTWRGEFTPAPGGTSVVMTETVRTPAVLGRVFARLFAPAGAHLDLYLIDLKKSLGDPNA